MTIRVRHFVLLLFTLAISAATAKANTITLNYDFSASGFPSGAPVDPVTGSFSVTFDDTLIYTDETSGIVVNLNIPVGSPPAFNYAPAVDVLYIFGSLDTPDNFLMVIGGASTASPNLSLFRYTSSSFPDQKFFPEELELTPSVPEPATLSLLGLGLASMGARRWRQRKGA